jgi:uncharacterized protein (UPF0332 family)
MKNSNFLTKLKKEGKLELVEPSEEISLSYEKKGVECREVAKLALKNNYFESAVIQSYYSMYDNVLSLFFICGIKCENHSASAIILKEFFNQEDLYFEFSKAKEERIDKQYYTSNSQINPITKDSAQDIINTMLVFNPKIIAFKNNLKLEEIKEIRKKLKIL